MHANAMDQSPALAEGALSFLSHPDGGAQVCIVVE
tara:strand:+ start:364 stop:468 length:105 start_codon:yes stop_codon:yes gene_type:complete